MTPGPVEVDPRVLRALSAPILGQFDPEFTGLMNRVMVMLRELFQTRNQWAYPVDGTSRSGIEAVLASLIEPGDKVLIPIYGRFGYLLYEIAERCGAEIIVMEREWGSVFEPDEIIAAIRQHRPAVVAMVHGETSTGRMQPVEGIGAACREAGALLVMDAVATIGGVPVRTDDWQVDAVIGGTQKCLSVPSGMAPVTYSGRAERKLQARKSVERGLWAEPRKRDAALSGLSGLSDPAELLDPSGIQSADTGIHSIHSAGSVRESVQSLVQQFSQVSFQGSIQGSSSQAPSFQAPSKSSSQGPSSKYRPFRIQSNYLDLSQLQDYWSPARLNHHTEMTSMLYGLYEGLRLVLNEGLENRFARHRLHEAALIAGLQGMGLSLYGDPGCKLPVVTCVTIPEGVDGEQVRARLLADFGIEIASSFGPLKGKIWRIGTMGYSCRKTNVLHLLGALEAVLLRSGCKLPAGAAVQAALEVYEARES
ncbi:pyridoxal-phosphate-dependent aminotransferase family protein [Paenibacillus pinistramenti]|uniref:pyridoxal-phosphate-dependent aminotransferase family protein n=1 Tax=Paenibacillus pinistramenti TaxID=1768003 RepID=UPI0011098B9B|nr:alanine--glyoxylate aminotransferase family protein [Paenibacillus pinistramenti]